MNQSGHASIHPLIAAHFAGRISPDRERKLRTHLMECSECRASYDRHLVLSELDPAFPSAEQRLAVGLGLSPRPRSARIAVAGWAAATAMAALVLLVVPLRARHDDYTARGAAPIAGDPQVLIYQVGRGQKPRAPRGTIGAGDELAFAYANSTGYRRLMIFGVDEHRHVYWYHPAWSDGSLDPHGVEIAGSAGVTEIPEAIRHDIDGHELTVVAVFTNDDLSVRKIEEMVRASADPTGPLPLRGSFQQQFHYQVER
jgi:Putative zinc-finger